MAKYLINKKRWLGERVAYPGEVIEFDGRPGEGMEPIDAAAKKAVAEEQERKARLAEVKVQGELAAAALAKAQHDLDAIKRDGLKK